MSAEFGEKSPLKEKSKIARKIEDLPTLKEGYMRVVHITSPRGAKNILKKGLDYTRNGMAMSMARAYSKMEEVEFGCNDPRFNFRGNKVVVMDVQFDEWRLHNDVVHCPGIIPKEQIVGIVNYVYRKDIPSRAGF